MRLWLFVFCCVLLMAAPVYSLNFLLAPFRWIHQGIAYKIHNAKRVFGLIPPDSVPMVESDPVVHVAHQPFPPGPMEPVLIQEPLLPVEHLPVPRPPDAFIVEPVEIPLIPFEPFRRQKQASKLVKIHSRVNPSSGGHFPSLVMEKGFRPMIPPPMPNSRTPLDPQLPSEKLSPLNPMLTSALPLPSTTETTLDPPLTSEKWPLFNPALTPSLILPPSTEATQDSETTLEDEMVPEHENNSQFQRRKSLLEPFASTSHPDITTKPSTEMFDILTHTIEVNSGFPTADWEKFRNVESTTLPTLNPVTDFSTDDPVTEIDAAHPANIEPDFNSNETSSVFTADRELNQVTTTQLSPVMAEGTTELNPITAYTAQSTDSDLLDESDSDYRPQWLSTPSETVFTPTEEYSDSSVLVAQNTDDPVTVPAVTDTITTGRNVRTVTPRSIRDFVSSFLPSTITTTGETETLTFLTNESSTVSDPQPISAPPSSRAVPPGGSSQEVLYRPQFLFAPDLAHQLNSNYGFHNPSSFSHRRQTMHPTDSQVEHVRRRRDPYFGKLIKKINPSSENFTGRVIETFERLVMQALAQDKNYCIARSICLVATNPDEFGPLGRSLTTFFKDSSTEETDLVRQNYRAAAFLGEATKSKETCLSVYPNCEIDLKALQQADLLSSYKIPFQLITSFRKGFGQMNPIDIYKVLSSPLPN